MSAQAETKVDTIVKVVLVFFVCLLSFSVGTYVGDRFSNYKHRIAQLTGEQSQDMPTDLASLEVNSETVTATPSEMEAMTSDEVAKLAASLEQVESENIDLANSKSKETQIRDIASTPETTKSEPATSLPAQKNTETVTETRNAEAKVDTTSKMQANEVKANYAGKYTVQIGSFPTETEAEKLTQDLNKKGLSAFYIAAKVADKKNESLVKTWYRVNIGLYGSSKEAESSKNDLMSSKSITNGFVQKINE